MNTWKQTRQYACPKCGANYLHDQAYHHALFMCLKRDSAKRQE